MHTIKPWARAPAPPGTAAATKSPRWTPTALPPPGATDCWAPHGPHRHRRARYQYSYDGARQLTRQSNSRGQDLTFTYDGAGQMISWLTAKSTANGASANLTRISTYQYDLAGQRTLEQLSQTAPCIKTTAAYDA